MDWLKTVIFKHVTSPSLYEIYRRFERLRSVILPVVLYGCETKLLTLREECRLRVFENRTLRRIFGPKKDEVIGE
jgi:hypothetical protein